MKGSEALVLLLACVCVAAGPTAPGRAGGDETELEIDVLPAADGELEWDSPEVLRVRDLLVDLSAAPPSCPSGAVEKRLESAWPGHVQEEATVVDYRWILFQGEPKHVCFHITAFRVEFGRERAVRVEVRELESRGV